jgi:hypothetical protein
MRRMGQYFISRFTYSHGSRLGNNATTRFLLSHLSLVVLILGLGDKILLAKNLSEITKVFGPEALLLDPLPLLLCAHAFSHLRPRVQAARMRHWQKVTQEIDDLHERRDIRVLRERTGFDGAKLKVLRAEFKALSMDGSGITFLQFQQVLGRVLPHWADTPLERIFEVFDEDADKILSFQEVRKRWNETVVVLISITVNERSIYFIPRKL